ncbi:GumC family protein [Lutibacter sp.]|uniref:GumC family protein n=1 Tax=Lutibacter sp. TaxID=1925666 RepID=UPI003563367D
MQEENNQLPNIQFQDESINIRQEVEKYAYYWKWFVLGAFVSLVVAYVYLRYTPNQYEVSTTILINDEDSGGLASELSAFQDLGLFSGSKGSSIENEIELLKSRSLIERVVKDVGINVSYFKKGRVRTSEIFKNEVPVKLNVFTKDSLFYAADTSFTIVFGAASKFKLLDSEGNKVAEHSFGENIKTNFGEITITPLADVSKIKDNELQVVITPIKKVVDNLKSAIQVQPVNKNASVLQLSLKSELKTKAQAILDNLVYQYNKDAVEDKSMIAKNTNVFINKRLDIISEDLSDVDKGVEKFKTSNNLTDITSEATLILGTNADIEKKIVDLNTQIRLVDYVNEYVTQNSEELIPANLGLPDESISSTTERYNELLLERNRILKSSSKLNPVIINLNDQIAGVRNSIAKSLVNLKNTLKISLNDVQKQESRINSKITAVPRQEREYRDIQRQQQIIETLYLYLLQKREENAITLAVTQPNAKIIDKAYGSDIPVAPKRKIVYLAALLLGIILPFAVIYLKLLLNNKVQSRKDIEAALQAPILGDIPRTRNLKKLVVSDQDRSGIAEAFRLVRTNINFMFSKVQTKSKTIFLTSTISGEGKTFIAINLASVLALTSKKVLLVGADIRSPKIISYLNFESNLGLTHFLRDSKLAVPDVIENVKEYNFDMIHSGIIPPNPAELLMNGRFDEVMEYAKNNYDYIIVDTAPINLVTDTLLISDYADLFIYVIRANHLDKRLLEVPKMLYNEKRLNNMSILVNDVDSDKGYGYGYGYGYGDDDKKPFTKKSFKDFFKR